MNNRSIELSAPAKINYLLEVLRKRSDGYHDLRMIMQRVDLCDTIKIRLTDSDEIRVICGRKGVPDGPDNIAWRAAKAMLDLAAEPIGAEIEIIKRIPVAAGLGGGSSDAATVLMGLNDLLPLSLDVEGLMKIGVTLGADVPFFILGKTSIAQGIGEKLSPIETIPYPWIVLVNPNLHVSTAWVFKNLRLASGENIRNFPGHFNSTAELSAVLANDLETVTASRFPVINIIKEELIRHGALNSLMSGSGPTVFGIFESEKEARRGAKDIAEEHGWFTAAVRALE